MAKRRFFVTYNSAVREVYPLGPVKFTWDNEQDQIFKRRKLSSKLLFRNDTLRSISDFTYFSQIELAGNGCVEIKLETKILCAGEYIHEWYGYFSTGAGALDFDKCEFEVNAEPNDKYRCIFDNWEIEFNMFETEQLVGVVTGVGNYVTLVSNTTGNFSCCDNKIPSFQSGQVHGYHNSYASVQDMIDKGWCIKSEELVPSLANSVDSNTQCVADLQLANPANFFSVGETIHQPLIGGTTATICYVEWVDAAHTIQRVYACGFVGPIVNFFAGGTTQYDNAISGGTAIGVPIFEYFNMLLTVKTTWHAWETDVPCVAGVCDPAVPPTWYFLSNDCAGSDTCKYRHCAGINKDLNYRGVSYKQMIANRIAASCAPLELTSIILDYNPDTSDPHYAAGIDYITGAFSRIHNLVISQKSDIINPQATDPAFIGMLKLKTLLDWAREVFEIYWDIVPDNNGDLVLRLEHFDFFEQQFSGDLRLPQYKQYVNNKNNYQHTKERIPQFEKFKWVEAGGIDFIGRDIIYSLPCATAANDVTHSPDNLTTDMFFLLNNLNASNEGFVMIACDLVSNALTVNVDIGLLTGLPQQNGYLSWANLHYNYHRYNRYLSQAIMNDVQTNFFSWRPNIKQATLDIPACCDIPEPEGYLLTELGEEILDHYRASIEKMDLDGDSDMLTLTLTYSI